MADLKSVCKEFTLDANPNDHSDYGFGKQMNTGDSARDVSVVTSHEFRAALTTVWC